MFLRIMASYFRCRRGCTGDVKPIRITSCFLEVREFRAEIITKTVATRPTDACSVDVKIQTSNQQEDPHYRA